MSNIKYIIRAVVRTGATGAFAPVNMRQLVLSTRPEPSQTLKKFYSKWFCNNFHYNFFLNMLMNTSKTGYQLYFYGGTLKITLP